jgi:hypothetical protein
MHLERKSWSDIGQPGSRSTQVISLREDGLS